MTVFPRSVGTFLMSRSEISLKEVAVSRIAPISSAGTPSSPSRCRCVNVMPVPSSSLAHDRDHDLVQAVRLGETDVDLLAPRRRQILPDVVRPDRQLAMPAVDEHRQLDRLRPAEVDEGV